MRFYKVTNEKENHHGFQYHDGLNIDPNKFRRRGTCVAGGIYFSREDILAFLSYGPWLRRVEIPEDAKMVQDPGPGPTKWRASKIFLHPRERITAEVVERLIAEGADVRAAGNEALKWAAGNGYTATVKLLLEHGADVGADDNCALRLAAWYGHTEVVEILEAATRKNKLARKTKGKLCNENHTVL